jgi:formate--tetrahydrofolate ligase
LKFAYPTSDSIETKIKKIACGIYGASQVIFKPAAKKQLDRIQKLDIGHFPVCIAKTQYSFSENKKAYGLPKDFTLTIRDIVINTGSKMIVAIAGNILRMPGLPKAPQAERIRIIDNQIEGLS